MRTYKKTKQDFYKESIPQYNAMKSVTVSTGIYHGCQAKWQIAAFRFPEVCVRKYQFTDNPADAFYHTQIQPKVV